MNQTAEGRSYRGLSAEDRHVERRERLLAAGLELFGTLGYAATSVRAVARTAGVGERYFYEHFSDRPALLVAVVERAALRLMGAIYADVAKAPPDLEARFRAGLQTYFTALQKEPREARVLFVECVGVNAELERRRHDILDQFAVLLAAHAEELGIYATDETVLKALGTGLVGATHAMAVRGLLDGKDLVSLVEPCVLMHMAVAERLNAQTG